MPFEQTRDVIERARSFHRELAAIYHRLERDADREKARMLLDYLAAHEERMEQRLSQFEEETAAGILNAWYARPPSDDLTAKLTNIELRPDLPLCGIVCAALRLDEALLRLYRQAADAAPTAEVREVFESLLEEGKAERAKLVFGLFEPDV